MFTVGRNYLSEEVMAITEASADSFEQKRRALLHDRRTRVQSRNGDAVPVN
jgi:hypothetical protein